MFSIVDVLGMIICSSLFISELICSSPFVSEMICSVTSIGVEEINGLPIDKESSSAKQKIDVWTHINSMCS